MICVRSQIECTERLRRSHSDLELPAGTLGRLKDVVLEILGEQLHRLVEHPGVGDEALGRGSHHGHQCVEPLVADHIQGCTASLRPRRGICLGEEEGGDDHRVAGGSRLKDRRLPTLVAGVDVRTCLDEALNLVSPTPADCGTELQLVVRAGAAAVVLVFLRFQGAEGEFVCPAANGHISRTAGIPREETAGRVAKGLRCQHGGHGWATRIDAREPRP
mmetsp:Transcript_25329/g.57609  ORF Transcript_25329/g.57609 Transcript_25329/m.57609 type:complete len:218 (+) Transcript_25329:10-663(+)